MRGALEWQLRLATRLIQPQELTYYLAASGTDLLVVTSRRVLRIGGKNREPALSSFWYECVAAVDSSRGFLNNGIVLSHLGERVMLHVDAKQVDPLVAAVGRAWQMSPKRRPFTSDDVVAFIESETGLLDTGSIVLAHRVTPDESLLAAAASQYNGTGCYVMGSTTRLLVGGIRAEFDIHLDLPLQLIRGVDITPGVWHSRLSIHTAGDRHDFTWTHKADAERLMLAIDQLQDGYLVDNYAQEEDGVALGGVGLAAELARLAALHQANVLSDTEFAQAKARLLR